MPDQDMRKAKPSRLSALVGALIRGYRKDGGFTREVAVPAGDFMMTQGVAAGVVTEATAGGANVTTVEFQVVDADSNPVEAIQVLTIFLSDDDAGEGLTAVTASGDVGAAAAGGEVFGTLTAKKALVVQTLDDGTFTLQIEDDAKTEFFPCAVIPSTGQVSVGTQLETADYGA